MNHARLQHGSAIEVALEIDSHELDTNELAAALPNALRRIHSLEMQLVALRNSEQTEEQSWA